MSLDTPGENCNECFWVSDTYGGECKAHRFYTTQWHYGHMNACAQTSTFSDASCKAKKTINECNGLALAKEKKEAKEEVKAAPKTKSDKEEAPAEKEEKSEEAPKEKAAVKKEAKEVSKAEETEEAPKEKPAAKKEAEETEESAPKEKAATPKKEKEAPKSEEAPAAKEEAPAKKDKALKKK
jgi:hypothetical protein